MNYTNMTEQFKTIFKNLIVQVKTWMWKAQHDIWESGGTTPHILNFGTIWRWVVSFMRLLYPLWKEPPVLIG